jgi:hypothetical protein
MSLAGCIPELVAQGKLSEDQARRAQELFDGHSAELRKSMSPAAADAVASKRTLEALDFEAIHKRQNALLQVKATDFAEDWLTRGRRAFRRRRSQRPAWRRRPHSRRGSGRADQPESGEDAAAPDRGAPRGDRG